MNDQSRKTSLDRRKQHNSDLLRRMRNGDPLNVVDSRASWYPPRPIIKKDSDEMARVYQAALTAPLRRDRLKPTAPAARSFQVVDITKVVSLRPFDEAG